MDTAHGLQKNKRILQGGRLLKPAGALFGVILSAMPNAANQSFMANLSCII